MLCEPAARFGTMRCRAWKNWARTSSTPLLSKTYIVDMGEGKRRQRSVVSHLDDDSRSRNVGCKSWTHRLERENGERRRSGVGEGTES